MLNIFNRSKMFSKAIAFVLSFTILFVQMQMPIFAASKSNNSGVKSDISFSIEFGYKMGEEFSTQVSLIGKNIGTKREEVINFKNSERANLEVKTIDNKKLKVTILDLPLDTYTLSIKAKGYKHFSKDIVLDTYSKHINLFSYKNSFTTGDVNEDGIVDEKDFNLLDENLFTKNENYDINGDGQVDVVDLTQTYWGIENTDITKDDAVEQDNKVILGAVVNTTKLNEEFKKSNPNITVSKGNLSDILTGGGVVEFKSSVPVTYDNPISIPIPVQDASKEIKANTVSITLPEDSGINGGVLVYEDSKGVKQSIPFSTDTKVASLAIPKNINKNAKIRIETKAGRRVVTIDIGSQVPIQKITINVTDVKNGLVASISKIEFLEDVVNDAITQQDGSIKNFTGKASNSQVTLNWDNAPNSKGYEVSYYMIEKSDDILTANVSSNLAEIKGLTNLKDYNFKVRAVADDWRGEFSNEIKLTPKPVSKPPIPANFKLTSQDSSLEVRYIIDDEKADGSKIYYRQTDSKDFEVKEVKGKSSRVYLKNLTNDKVYEVYVVATVTNEKGEILESNKTATLKASPTKYEIQIPNVPTYKEIPNSSIEDIKFLAPNSLDKSQYSGEFEPTSVIDNNYETAYTGLIAKKDRQLFELTFDKAYEMDYLSYIPRLDKNLANNQFYYRYPESYEIWISPDLTTPYKKVSVGKPLIEKDKGLKIARFDKSNVRRIKIGFWDDYNKGWPTTVSEVKFYEYDDTIDKINALFTDNSYSELKSTVTSDQIEELKTKLNKIGTQTELVVSLNILLRELDLATDLLANGNASTKLGNIITVNQTLGKKTGGETKFAMGLSRIQPLGVVALRNNQITIYADIKEPTKGKLSLIRTQYHEFTEYKDRELVDIILVPGRNIFTMPRLNSTTTSQGGSLYVSYIGDTQAAIKLQIVGGTKIPTLDLTVVDNTTATKDKIRDYVTELNAYMVENPLTESTDNLNPKNMTEIGTPDVLLSVPAKVVYDSLSKIGDIEAQTQRLLDTVIVWKGLLKLHYQDILGLEEGATNPINELPKSRQNIRYNEMVIAKAFMYAASGHIGIGYGSAGALVSQDNTSKEGAFGWGINHEIGHVINSASYMIVEVTNNLFALFNQTSDGAKSRLEDSHIYNKAYEKIVSGDSGLASNVFVTLAMFWQLHLAFDGNNNTADFTKFYKELNRAFREDSHAGKSNFDRFARISSDVSNKDLTEFFTAWGLPITEETKGYMASKTNKAKKIQYLNDTAYRYKVGGGKSNTSFTFTPTAKAEKEKDANGNELNDISIKIELPPLPNDMLGYEIRQVTGTDENIVGFVTNDSTNPTANITFVDTKVYNNLSYSYKIVPYDLLLNAGTEQSIPEIKISMDTPVNDANFKFTKANGVINIDMQKEESVVGIKVKVGDTNTPIDTVTKTANNLLGIKDVTKTVDTSLGVKDDTKDSIVDDTTNVKDNDLTVDTLVDDTLIDDTTKVLDNIQKATNAPSGVKIEVSQDGTNYTVAKVINGKIKKDEVIYFNKPDVTNDMRIWTYDARYIRITGLNYVNSKDEIALLQYPGDSVAFTQDGIGYLGKDHTFTNTNSTTTFKKGTVVIMGTYTGNPVYSKIILSAEYENPKQGITENGNINSNINETKMESAVNGDMYLFAELPKDGKVSEVESGAWLFVPENQPLDDNQEEAVQNLLPERIRANMYRADAELSPNESNEEVLKNARLVSNTQWQNVPLDGDMPEIIIKGAAID